MYVYNVKAMHVCTCTCGCLWLTTVVFLDHSPSCFFETAFLSGPGAHRLASPLSIKLQYPLISGPSALGLQMCTMAPAFR